MVNLSVEIAGITFKNPIIIASGTPTINKDNMLKCIKAGAAGLVTKTVTYAKLHQLQPRPRFKVIHPEEIVRGGYFSLYSIELMSPYDPSTWSKHLKAVKSEAKKNEVVLIASIAGRNLDEWGKLAKLAEDSGADMIELNLSCPHVEEEEGSLMGKVVATKDRIIESIVKVIRENASIPVIGKLTPHGANPLDSALTLERVGVDAIVATARFQGLIIDIETMRPILWGGFGGYGGPWMVPISCGWVAKIALHGIKVPIIGSGGISDYSDIIRFLLVGAKAVQVCTAVIIKGFKVISEMINDLENWLYKRGFNSVNDIVGKSLSEIVPLERLDRETKYKAVIDKNRCTLCGICRRSCFYSAIDYVNRRLVVNHDVCDGCGLCVSLCPQNAIKLIKVE